MWSKLGVPGILTPPRGLVRPEWPYCVNHDSPQSDGLVAWWPLGNSPTDEDDLFSGIYRMGNQGSTLQGDSIMHLARQFVPGSSQYMLASAAVLTAEPVSLCGWFTTGITSAQCILSISVSGSRNNFNLGLNDFSTNGVDALVISNASSGQATTSSAPTLGIWQHGCAVFGGFTSRAAYLNGASKGTDTAACSPATPGVMTIGATYYLGTLTNFFSGLLADLRVYNRVVSDEENLAWFSDPRLSQDLYYPLNRRMWSFPGPTTAAPTWFPTASRYAAPLPEDVPAPTQRPYPAALHPQGARWTHARPRQLQLLAEEPLPLPNPRAYPAGLYPGFPPQGTTWQAFAIRHPEPLAEVVPAPNARSYPAGLYPGYTAPLLWQPYQIRHPEPLPEVFPAPNPRGYPAGLYPGFPPQGTTWQAFAIRHPEGPPEPPPAPNPRAYPSGLFPGFTPPPAPTWQPFAIRAMPGPAEPVVSQGLTEPSSRSYAPLFPGFTYPRYTQPTLVTWDPQAGQQQRRHEQYVAAILNSLLRAGGLKQVDQLEWKTGYVPGTPGNWNWPPPSTVGEALDRLAAFLTALTAHNP